MAAILVCPICGCLPADNGTDTSKTNNVVNATTGVDVNGNAAHCPLCGTAQIVVDQTHVNNVTNVASGSQHPADIDATYTVQTFAGEAQFGSTAYTVLGQNQKPFPHAYAVPNRGSATVTAETVNATVGP